MVVSTLGVGDSGFDFIVIMIQNHPCGSIFIPSEHIIHSHWDFMLQDEDWEETIFVKVHRTAGVLMCEVF